MHRPLNFFPPISINLRACPAKMLMCFYVWQVGTACLPVSDLSGVGLGGQKRDSSGLVGQLCKSESKPVTISPAGLKHEKYNYVRSGNTQPACLMIKLSCNNLGPSRENMTAPDQEILRAIGKGDTDAFQKVFNDCYESLCQYAFTILKDMDESEDIVQATFIRIWENRKELDIRHTVRSYLFKAVYHKCINQLEHRTVKLKYQDHGLRERSSQVQHPEVFPDELEENIKSAINRLPPQCRLIFVMSRYEELRYSEIARKLNISVNTVENQVSKALKILRTELKNIFV
jgi:RNA polymerase sigma-70 factor (ECF subfamily)